MSSNPLDGAFDDVLNRSHVPALSQRDLIEIDGEARMQDLRIAEVLGYGSVKEIRRLISRHTQEISSHGVLRQIDAKPTSGSQGGRPERIFALNEAQSLLVAMFSRTAQAATVRAQIIEVFLAWRHGKLAPQQPPATSREVTVTGLDSEALGQVGGVFRNVARRQGREMLRAFEDAIDQAVIEYVGVAVPRLNAFVQELTAKHVQPLSDKVDQLISEMRSARQSSEAEPIALPRMGLRTFRKMRGWSMAKMGKMVGATASAVAKHEHGVCIPAPHIMDRYFEASGGRLTPDTFYDAYRARWGGVRPRSTRQPVTTNVSEGEA